MYRYTEGMAKRQTSRTCRIAISFFSDLNSLYTVASNQHQRISLLIGILCIFSPPDGIILTENEITINSKHEFKHNGKFLTFSQLEWKTIFVLFLTRSVRGQYYSLRQISSLHRLQQLGRSLVEGDKYHACSNMPP